MQSHVLLISWKPAEDVEQVLRELCPNHCQLQAQTWLVYTELSPKQIRQQLGQQYAALPLIILQVSQSWGSLSNLSEPQQQWLQRYTCLAQLSDS